MSGRHPLFTFLLVGLFVLDITTDIGTGIELILNDHHGWGILVLGFVGFPAVMTIVAELLRGCVYSGCCGEASTDWIPLIFYHLYTLIMMIGSGCQDRWLPETNYLRAVHGFLQAGPQLVLQLIVVFKGVLIHSFRDTLKALLEDGFSIEFFQDKSLRWYWGLIQFYSLITSALSLLIAVTHFNEWPKRRHTLHRILVVVPFFLATLTYRIFSMAILIVFAGQIALIPITILAFSQIVTLNSLGLDLARSIVYGFCGLLAPIGYSRCRDPDNQPYGLTLLPGYMSRCEGSNTCPGEGDRNPEQVEMLRERSKNYLAMHIILGGGILGISVAIIFMLINFTMTFDPLSSWIILNPYQMNEYFFPGLGSAYCTAVLLTGIFTCCIGRCFEEEYIYPV